MSGKTPIRQIRPFSTAHIVRLLLCASLYVSAAQAATKETADQSASNTIQKEQVAAAQPEPGKEPKAQAEANKSITSTEQNTGQTAAGNPAAPAPIPEFPASLEGAKQAFQQGYYSVALKILAKLEEKNAGQIEFDYLLGRTAIEVKSYDLAIAALTRVLTIDPSFAAARFEIARANYSKGVAKLARGPFETARTEFRIVLQQQPPEPIEQAIQQYLKYIEKYLEVKSTEYYLYIELGGGYDTNISSISDNAQFGYYDPFTAQYETYDLEKYREKRESAFGLTQVGIGIALPVFSNNFEIFGGLMVGGKSYSRNHDYDHSWSQVNFGARHYGNSDKKTIQARFKSTNLVNYKNDNNNNNNNNDNKYHDEGEVRLQWDIRANKTNALSLWLLGGDSNYQLNGTNVYSVSYHRTGMEWTHLLEGKRKSSFQVMLMDGRDDPQYCQNYTGPCPQAYTREVSGLRLAWSNNIFSSSRFYTSAYFEYSEYDQKFFHERRLDRRSEFFMGIDTKFGTHWHLRPELYYTDNNSSIRLHDFERGIASLTLRLEF